MQLSFDTIQLESKSKRKPDSEYEKKKLLIPEFLALINTNPKYKPYDELRFKIRMMDAGYKTAQSWMELLAEMKQSKNPGGYWGNKMK